MKHLPLLAVLTFAACGDNRSASINAPLNDTPDAPDAGLADAGVDASSDAPVDAPADATIYPPCDYVEQADLTNGYTTSSEIESTPLATGPYVGSTFTICGNINADHYDATSEAIDIDRYTFSVQDTATVTLKFSGRIVYITKLNSGTVGVFVYDHTTGATVFEGGDFADDDAEFSATLPTGEYDLSIEAHDTQQDVFSSIPYAVEVDGS